MKNLITILLLSYSATAFSLSDTIAKKEYKFGGFFSPEQLQEISRLDLGNYTGYGLQRSYFNYSVGLVGRFPVTKKLDIGTGITYSQKDLKGTYYCESCDTYGPSPSQRLNLRFLEAPVFIQYNILNGKIKLHAQGGFTLSYLISKPDLWFGERPDLKASSTTYFNRPLSKLFIGLGTNIDLGKKINFQLTPTYNYSLNYLYKDTNLKMHSFGVALGLTYRIQK